MYAPVGKAAFACSCLQLRRLQLRRLEAADLRRNTALRCGNPRAFTLSKLPWVILARLVLLVSAPFLRLLPADL